MKQIIIAVLLVALGAGFYGYKQFDKKVDKIASLTADAKIDAKDLFVAFESDETAANKKYLDKVIEVSGRVIKVDVENEKTSIYLETDDMLGTILCQLEATETSTLKKGDQARIKGVCSGYLTDVVIVRAMVLK